ncbi:AraC family transcriptional regulator [Actinoplanes sp. TBRC 11911]|uniref:AraC family transcriptional regulator n=1 Tax=Actinoplanes sp. TBRC 11911 TaxID=2729386 RepID=UPI00145F012E|nr:AraC family transcriptional regulator [Actinoplanes sp. TBRC 11911]NMO49704.1 AraC family transcriptional regulator [Actinoplanes sp. TBRC 11911]
MNGPFVIGASPQARLTSIEDVLDRSVPAFYPHTLDQLVAAQRFSTDCRFLRAGPITVVDATVRADIRMDFAEGRNGYHANVALSGGLRSRHRGVDLLTTAETATFYRPSGETSVTHWTAGTRILAVKMDLGAVERILRDTVRGPVADRWTPSVDVRGGPGRSWVRMLRHLTTELADPDSVLHQPMAAMPFVEAVLSGFLMVASPAFRQTLDRPAEPARPAAVRDATDIIDAEAHRPLTTAELARRCHVSVRTLQEGFQRHLGIAPMAYLRSVRLDRAHAELRAADPARDTVGAIARRWGFTNLTRFANQHRKAYGQYPHETLRIA